VISIEASWTFPLNFAEIIMGNGEKVYRKRINLDQTLAFGNKKFLFTTGIKKYEMVKGGDLGCSAATAPLHNRYG
jgi:hypothetical protein